jgi:divisome-associated membrane protein
LRHLVTFSFVLTFNSRIMADVFSRIVELIGWVVLGVSALLLVIAHHIDNYQSPPPANVVQTK